MVIRFPRERGRAEIVLFVSGAYLALIYDQDRRGPDLGTMAVGRMTYFFIGLPIVPQFGLLIDHEGARLKLLRIASLIKMCRPNKLRAACRV